MCASTNQYLFDSMAKCKEDEAEQADLFGVRGDMVVSGDTAVRPNGRVVPWCGPGHPSDHSRDALICELSQLGDVLFCNPTYSNIGPFATRLVRYVQAGDNRWGILLVKSSQATAWFTKVHRHASAIWTFSSRLKHLRQRFDGMERVHVGGSNIESTLLIFSSRGPDLLGPRYGVLDGSTFEPVTSAGKVLWSCVGPKDGREAVGGGLL